MYRASLVFLWSRSGRIPARGGERRHRETSAFGMTWGHLKAGLSYPAKRFPPGLVGELSPNYLGLRDAALSHDG